MRNLINFDMYVLANLKSVGQASSLEIQARVAISV